MAIKHTKHQKKLLDQGLCRVCGKPKVKGNKNFCEEHRIAHNETMLKANAKSREKKRQAKLLTN